MGLFAKIDPILADLVLQSKPIGTSADATSKMNSSTSNKRKSESNESLNGSPKKKANVESINGSLTLSQREKRAMELLASYLEERGGMLPTLLAYFDELLKCQRTHSIIRGHYRYISGERVQSENFRCKVVLRPGGRYDSIFFSAENKRFKSMAEVARFLNLMNAPVKGQGGNFKASIRGKNDAEKRKLKRELDKLMKLKVKAEKMLDDHINENIRRLPASNDSILDDGSHLSKSHKTGLIVPRADIDFFPGIPTHCIPDLLLVWDFLCTFSRILSLEPIELDDFAAALTFRPSAVISGAQSDEEEQHLPLQSQIPVFLSECHIALLRLLVKDGTSDLWWWSVLETPEMVEQEDEYLNIGYKKRRAAAAVVKIDMDALLTVEEDPVVTRKWLQALEDVRTRKPDNSGPIKSAVKSAIAVTTNQHVKIYLKKAMRKWRAKSAGLVKRAVVWLVDRFREARPDLWGRSVSHNEIVEQKKLVAAEAALEMDSIVEDVDFDENDLNLEGDSDEESDYDEDEGSDNEDEYAEQADTATSPAKPLPSVTLKENDEVTLVTTFVPAKPVPSVVDLLLPPSKPTFQTDVVNAMTWPPVIGATSSRIFQWYKRRRNEVDDGIREFRQLRPMSIAERRRRESYASLRILSECGDSLDDTANHVKSAIKHLCDGECYLDLTSTQRLCILRMLIEAAYDTHHLQSTIEENFKARDNAVKALDAEERRAKKAAREELAAIESAARERLAAEARETFIEKKRQELIEDIKDTQEYSVDFIESLNDDDIIDLDDDSKAEYEALPTADSFSKSEVNAVVKTIQEETAFGAEKLTVLTLNEIIQRDEELLKSFQDELESVGEVNSREASAKIDRIRLKITKHTENMESLSQDRNSAIDALKDAIEDGTVRTLRNAIKEAKLARLSGVDEDNGGAWALDLVRDASLELKNAEGRKRVTEAQKDLVAKRNKCFIRTESLGRDRQQSTFFHFDYDKGSSVWVERDFFLCNDICATNKEAGLFRSTQSTSIGVPDMCDDFLNQDDRDQPSGTSFLHFSRQEYHHTGELSTLANHHWSCYTNERSLRILVKNLDGKSSKENALKEVLKETLETLALAAAGGDSNHHPQTASPEDARPNGKDASAKVDFLSSGDEDAFCIEKKRLSQVDADLTQDISSATGRRVRLRRIPDPDRAPDVAEYSMGTIIGWKRDHQPIRNNEDGEESLKEHSGSIPIWRIGLDDGGELLLNAGDVLDGIVRAIKWSTEYPGYCERDSQFLSYRNNLGRFCGRAVEAPLSLTPQAFAKQLIKREQDLYMPMKNRTYENNWGGKAGARQAWVSSLKECGHTFDAVRDGLLTLENAFFELTGGFGIDEEKKDDDNATESNGATLSGKDLLYDTTSRFDIELESLGTDVKGLWNSPDAREIFKEIIRVSKSVSILALGLDLICRNAQAYINQTKSSVVQTTEVEYAAGAVVGRRRAAMNHPGAYTDFF